MTSTGEPTDTGDNVHQYTTQEIGEMLFDMHRRQAKYEKTLMSHRYDYEAFTNKQTVTNSNIDSTLLALNETMHKSTLRQTSTVETYQTMFESMIQKTSHVGDATLTSLFIAGLSPSIKQEMLARRPATLQDAFALAKQLASCQTAAGKASSFPPKPSWQPRETTSPQTRTTTATTSMVKGGKPPTDYPVVRLSDAERADRARRGLCYWCPEKYSRAHVCAKKFYALIGEDEDDDPLTEDNDDSANNEDASNMGHHFDIDLFLLQVEGPDVILGVQWLQELGDVTKNYRNLTMRFDFNGQAVFLKGESATPSPISYNNLFSLVSADTDADLFEVLPLGPTISAVEQAALDQNFTEDKVVLLEGGVDRDPAKDEGSAPVQADGPS
ncbi:hypothetical protein SASPL_111847 [Salvia splendens]|uniref:Ty3 transposon capsid-like protein domain-containing protein n=1 Tax=Salvia splendens TaxID=180675 RepID=A0A8X9A4Q2_SALSN|nr:hypothetical protein SASPL_111847 [Salvia splendens]